MRINQTAAMPPWWWDRRKRSMYGGIAKLATQPGNAAHGGWWVNGREHAIRRVLIYPDTVVPTDGATMFEATEVKCGEDMFTCTQKEHMGDVLKVYVLRKGESLWVLAERLAPGQAWFADYLLAVNRHSLGNQLQQATLEPEQVTERPAAGGSVGKKTQKKKGLDKQQRCEPRN